jgi:hypothetical protein
MWRYLPLLVLGAVACKSERDLSDQAFTDEWTQEPTNEIDILWVIDNSYSMELEQAALASGFATFIEEIESTGTVFHLGVVTTTMDYSDPTRGVLLGSPRVITDEHDYITIFQERVIVGVDGADKEKGLEVATYALSPEMTTGPNSGFLRRDANLLVVVVSDENDCSDRGVFEGESSTLCYTQPDRLVPVTEFVVQFRGLKDDPNKVRFAAIVGPKQSEGCLDAVPGYRYIQAAELMGGMLGNICQSDWGSMLYDLGLNASGIQASFQTTYAAQLDTIQVWVDDEVVLEDPGDGWTYDQATWYLTFNGSSVPERGSEIRCSYEIASGVRAPTLGDTGTP